MKHKNMMTRRILCMGLLGSLLYFAAQAQPLYIPPEEALKLGIKVWYNESGGTVAGLTTWNADEPFASLGIGHFIWYPDHHNHHLFNETFPALIRYMQSQGVTVPEWLQGNKIPDCPWPNREAFLLAKNSPRMRELRAFLVDTVQWQGRFMALRLKKALPRILAIVPADEHSTIEKRFDKLASTPKGLYVLIDYVNFKGEGAALPEKYHHQGWGLLQVLQEMRYAPNYLTPTAAFAWSANRVLTRRVHNAPDYAIEDHWLSGWRNRLKTYL